MLAHFYCTKPVKTARDALIKREALVKREALALHVVHHDHKHAAKAARLAHLLHLESKNLLNLHRQMHNGASAIAGNRYTDEHRTCFDKSTNVHIVSWGILFVFFC